MTRQNSCKPSAAVNTDKKKQQHFIAGKNITAIS